MVTHGRDQDLALFYTQSQLLLRRAAGTNLHSTHRPDLILVDSVYMETTTIDSILALTAYM